MKLNILALSLIALSLAACSKKDDKNEAKAGGGITATCRAAIAEDHSDTGCKITLLSPANCASVDLSGGKTAVFSFKAEGPNCRAPFKGFIAGHPVTRNADDSLNNVVEQGIGPHESVNNEGGEFQVEARHFQGLTTDDGTYDWLIENDNGQGNQASGPTSFVVRVKL